MKTIAEHLTAQNTKINEHTKNIKNHDNKLSEHEKQNKWHRIVCKWDASNKKYAIGNNVFPENSYSLVVIDFTNNQTSFIYNPKEMLASSIVNSSYDGTNSTSWYVKLSKDTKNNYWVSITISNNAIVKKGSGSSEDSWVPKDNSKVPYLNVTWKEIVIE